MQAGGSGGVVSVTAQHMWGALLVGLRVGRLASPCSVWSGRGVRVSSAGCAHAQVLGEQPLPETRAWHNVPQRQGQWVTLVLWGRMCGWWKPQHCVASRPNPWHTHLPCDGLIQTTIYIDAHALLLAVIPQVYGEAATGPRQWKWGISYCCMRELAWTGLRAHLSPFVCTVLTYGRSNTYVASKDVGKVGGFGVGSLIMPTPAPLVSTATAGP
jgi:hypothetical protein